MDYKGVRLSDQESNKALCDLMVQYGKMTEKEGYSMYIKLCAQDARVKQRQREEIRQEINRQNGDSPTQMITFALHQGLNPEDAIKAQYNIVKIIKKANYKWLVNPKIKFEYYSGEQKWNPHVHVLVDKTGRAGVIKQQIYRKFIEGKKAEPSVYNTDVTECKDDSQRDYMKGIKKDEKQYNVELDNKFREDNGIPEIM